MRVNAILALRLLALTLVMGIAPEDERMKAAVTAPVLLHSRWSYNADYLSSFRSMWTSLLHGTDLQSQDIDQRYLRDRHEPVLSGRRSRRGGNHLPHCSEAGLTRLKTLRVLQDEDANYVMLKLDERTGMLYVEKSVRSGRSYENELDFFRHYDAHTGLYARFACYMDDSDRHSHDYSHRGRYSVVTEFIPGRESHVFAMQASYEQLRRLTAQLFIAIAQMHATGFIHADIKPGNVLVTDDGQVRVIDFGMAVRVGHAKKYRGSPFTRAPELHDMCPGPVDEAIDWWAFGSTVAIWFYYHFNHPAVIKTGHVLYSVHQPEEMRELVANFARTSQYDFAPMRWTGREFRPGHFPHDFPPALRSFLALFLTIDPELREFNTQRLQELVRSHEFFTGVNWSTMKKRRRG